MKMSKKIAAIFITALIVAGMSGIAKSQNPGGAGGMNTIQNRGVGRGMKGRPCGDMNMGIDFIRTMKLPNLAQDLGITPEQAQMIRSKLESVKPKMEEAVDNACRLSEDLKNAVLAENPDRTEIYRLIDDLTYARQDLMKILADLQFEVLNVLKPEQWSAFRAMAADAQKPKERGRRKK
jgi:Spy/CpxP family protein refolding chaperone